YHEPSAGHKARIVGGEKDDALGDVVGNAEPADRVPRHCLLTHRIDIVATEARLTMALPCGLCRARSRNAGNACLVPRNTPVRLTAQSRCHSSRLASS